MQDATKGAKFKFKENYCGKVDEVRSVVMMRLETHRKKIMGVIQIMNFGEIDHRLRHDDFIVRIFCVLYFCIF